MLSEQDKETLKDGVHTVISGEFPNPTNVPFGVEWIRARLINRAYVSAPIAHDEDTAGIIAETMNTILDVPKAFPDVRRAQPDENGASRWVIGRSE